tara:strand:+ start:2135 stop:3517 length:1383 start_codon:yes stop_codon:yes gene_type:complete
MAKEFQNITDFSLKSVSITAIGSKDAYEIKQMVNTFSYVESVTSPFVAGTLTIADSAGLLNNLPIQGGESVRVIVETSTQDDPVIYDLLVWKIANRYAKNQMQAYTLGLISEEALNNEYIRLIKPLEGTGDAIINEVLQELGSKKELFSESTEFKIKMLPTNRRPFDIASSISVKSIAKGGVSTSKNVSKNEKQKVTGSAGFFFYETKRGYNFFSVDKLLSNNSNDTWGPYVEKPANQSDGADDRFTISQALFRSEVDVMQSMRKGKYSSLMVFFNHSTGQYHEFSYSLEDAYDSMSHLGSQNKPSIIKTADADKKVSDYPTRLISSILDHESWYNDPDIASYDEEDGAESPSEFCDFHKHYAAQSLMRYELLKNQLAEVVIPGNSGICAGDKIDIKLVNKAPTVQAKDEPYDQESSGVYLVDEVTHTYNSTESTNGRFVTTLRLMRDSYGDLDSNHGTK